jgi:type 1 fimbriae regulatory protein FimB/type 1 fimbriae regulatory protein FimE
VEKSQLELVGEPRENRTLPLRRPKNSELRTREYLTDAEVADLIEVSKTNRHGHRDSTMILVAYRHGLRVSELVGLRWDQVDFANARLHVLRAKNGLSSVHPLMDDELNALLKLKGRLDGSEYVFVSERGRQFSAAGFAKLIERAGAEAKLSFKAHPHMLRHACGYKLAHDGHDTRALQSYLGHRNIQHSAKYTDVARRSAKVA